MRDDFDSFDDFNPFKEMEDMMKRMGMNPGSKGYNMKIGSNIREPRVDVRENEKEYKIVIELPGLDKKDIDLRVKANHLVIKTQINTKKESNEESTMYREISSQQFYRTIPLPENADTSKLSAKYNNGILEVTLQKLNDKGTGRVSIE